MRNGFALPLLHNERDHQRGKQSGNKREGEQCRVMMIQKRKQRERCGWADDCTDGIHHPLETKRAPVGFLRDRAREESFFHGRSHTATRPRARTRNEHVPCARCEAKRCRRESGHNVTGDRDGFARAQTVGVVAARHFDEARKTVRRTLNDSEPRRRDAHRGEKRWHHCGSDFVRPIAEERRETNAKNGAVQPTCSRVRSLCGCRFWHFRCITRQAASLTQISEPHYLMRFDRVADFTIPFCSLSSVSGECRRGGQSK